MFESYTEKEILSLLKNNGLSIKFITNPSEKLKLIALKNDGYAIKYIKNPSESVQKEAVKSERYAIKYIENPTEKIQLLAIENEYKDLNPFKEIKNPTDKVINIVLEHNLNNIQFIDNYKDSIILKENWGTYDGKLILFKFKGDKYINAGCFTTNSFIEFKTKLLEVIENTQNRFNQQKDLNVLTVEIQDYLYN